MKDESYKFTQSISNKIGEKKYFICSRGIGDTIIFLSRIKTYFITTNKKVRLIIPTNQEVLIYPYRNYIEDVIVLTTEEINMLIDSTWENNKFSNLQFILPPKAIKLLENCSLFDLVGSTLNISGNDYQKPEFYWEMSEKQNVFNKYNIMNRPFAIIAPDAYSIKKISEAFWISVVQQYRKRNIYVLENGSEKENPLYGDKRIFLDIDKLFILAKDAVEITSIRSGLSDLLAFGHTKLKVVYPDYATKNLFTFSQMPFANNVEEYVYGKND